MPKQKTKKAAKKRFQVSSSGKVRRLHTHRAHFNGKDSGNETRHKHREQGVHKTDLGRIERLLPYA